MPLNFWSAQNRQFYDSKWVPIDNLYSKKVSETTNIRDSNAQMIFRFINTEKKFKRPSLIATPPVAKSRSRHAEKIQILRKMSTANVEYNNEYNNATSDNATSNNATSNNATSNIATPRSKSQPQFRNSSQSPPMSLPPPSDNRKGFESHWKIIVWRGEYLYTKKVIGSCPVESKILGTYIRILATYICYNTQNSTLNQLMKSLNFWYQ